MQGFMNWLTRQRWFSQDTYSSVVGLVIIYVAILTAFSAYQGGIIDIEWDRSNLEIQKKTIELTRTQTLGEFEADYAWAQAYRIWYEMDTYAYFAEDDNVRAAFEQARDRVTELSPLLQEPYFDPLAFFPEIEKYEVDLYIQDMAQQTLELKYLLEERNVLDEKSVIYFEVTEMMALVLILLGLSTTIISNQTIRLLILAFAIGMSGWQTIRFLEAYTMPFLETPSEAIQDYAEGVGLAHQLFYSDAIDTYSTAIDKAPDLTDAYVERGFAYRLLFNETGEMELLDQALPDFERAVTDGRREPRIIGQLSELYYLEGRFDEALTTSQLGIDETDDFIHYFDKGRNLFALGQVEEARASYQEGIDIAVNRYLSLKDQGQSPPVSFWRSFDYATVELDDLTNCLTNDVCDQTPPQDSLPSTDDILPTITEINTQLKNTTTSLEILQQPPGDPITATVDNIGFSITPESAMIAEGVFETGAESFSVDFDYEGFANDQIFSAKVFVDNRDYPPLRQIMRWQEGESGRYALPLALGNDTGNYTVQLYLDGQLIGQTSFYLDFAAYDYGDDSAPADEDTSNDGETETTDEVGDESTPDDETDDDTSSETESES